MAAYDDAVATLYRAAFTDFVAERKRLAAELKAAGDKSGAAQLLKRQRPPISAWAVNQLWWQQRAAVEQLIDVAGRVKVGDREAAKKHRESLSKLRELATQILQEAGNAATEATVRRVITTLSAIAANGGFTPDAPGALSADRDPPGFESLGFAMGSAAPTVPSGEKAQSDADERRAPANERQAEADKQQAEADKRRAEADKRRAEADKRRAEEEERKRRRAERERLSKALHEAQALQTTQKREVARLRSELHDAEQGLTETQALLARIEGELSSL